MVGLKSSHSLLAIFLASSRTILAGPALALSSQAGFSYNDLFARWDCGGPVCGYNSQLCCPAGSQCSTDYRNQAQCAAAATQAQAGGYWQYYTTTFVRTDLVTVTSVMSSYVGGVAPAAATATAQCSSSLNETPCGSICCASGQYCYNANQCVAAGNAVSSGFYNPVTTGTASAPLRPTSSSTVYITSTRSSSTTSTVPFQTPVATGANITLVGQRMTGGNSGLSGGAIAGIVVGVLAALALLALICFCCCIKGLLDGLLAIFGLGKKKRRTEVEEYERRSHHGRTWYGGSASRPSRVSRTEERKSHETRNLLGVGAGLAALWAVLGLKRRREQRRRDEEKYTEYSYGSTDYYTSASSASSDDRRDRRSDRISRAPSRR